MEVKAIFNRFREELTEKILHVMDAITLTLEFSENFSQVYDAMRETVDRLREKVVDMVLTNLEKAKKSLSEYSKTELIERIREEIKEQIEHFTTLAEDLRVLSFNTSVATFKLGSRGAALVKISREINERAFEAMNLMNEFNNAFSKMFDNLKSLDDRTQRSINIVDKLEISSSEDLKIAKSSVSTDNLIIHLQFQDIINQEVDVIESAVTQLKELEGNKDPYSLGYTYGLFEEIVRKIGDIKSIIGERIPEIAEGVKDLIFSVRSQLHHIFTMAEKMEDRIEEFSRTINEIAEEVNYLSEEVDKAYSYLKESHTILSRVSKLTKFLFTLKMLASIEVAIIGSKEVEGLVASMNEIHGKFVEFIKNVEGLLSRWSRSINESSELIKKLRLYAGEKLKSELDRAMEIHRDTFLKVHSEAMEFNQRVELQKDKLKELSELHNALKPLLEVFEKNIKAEMNNFLATVPKDLQESSEFKKGREEAKLKEFAPVEEAQGEVELF